MNLVFFGKYFHCISFEEFESVTDGYLAVFEGIVSAIKIQSKLLLTAVSIRQVIGAGPKSEYEKWNHPRKAELKEIFLSESQFLLPGFIDTHIHAPQYPNIGLGLDKPLLQWLDTYTFPTETEYKDENFAKQIYEKVVV